MLKGRKASAKRFEKLCVVVCVWASWCCQHRRGSEVCTMQQLPGASFTRTLKFTWFERQLDLQLMCVSSTMTVRSVENSNQTISPSATHVCFYIPTDFIVDVCLQLRAPKWHWGVIRNVPSVLSPFFRAPVIFPGQSRNSFLLCFVSNSQLRINLFSSCLSLVCNWTQSQIGQEHLIAICDQYQILWMPSKYQTGVKVTPVWRTCQWLEQERTWSTCSDEGMRFKNLCSQRWSSVLTFR